MGRVVSLVSGKGGVGKTTVSSNLGLVLNNMGKKTILVDGNVTTPNLSIHLGIPLYPITLHDVLKGNSDIREAMYVHPTGLGIIPGGIGLEDLENIDLNKVGAALNKIRNEADIILLDGAAGLGKEALKSIEVADDVIIVTNPNLPSVTEALKVKKIAEEFDKNVVGVIVNRVNGKKMELKDEEIEGMIELPVLVKIPEDPMILQSIHMKTPVVHFSPYSPSSLAFKKLGADLIGEEFEISGIGFIQRLMNWLRK
ncbi:MAG: cell division ATPase MinD [Candidatus Aenigmarchaeota archaeon]|nr:cell division ATPase MinD [Candidatus Aenigmarchaeota archaeon]